MGMRAKFSGIKDDIVDAARLSPEELRALAVEFERKAASDTISNSLEGKIAAVLHDALCTYNHTDGCGWGYEQNPFPSWTGAHSAHEKWRKHARELLEKGGYASRLLPLDEEKK